MSLLRLGDKKEHGPVPSMPPSNIMGRGLTRKAKQQPVTWLLKTGVLIVVGVLVFFACMILLNELGGDDEGASMYVWAMGGIAGIAAAGLFAGGIKAWPAWPFG